jgi:hypothetical protein
MKLTILHKVLIGVAIFSGLAFVVLKTRKNKSDSKKILLLGGLDNRPGDKSIASQVELLKKGLTKDIEVIGFRYTDSKGLYAQLDKDSSAIVVLFSAGCSKSEAVANKMLQNKEKLSNIYILEPYHTGGTTTKSVRKAVELGVPQKNVLVGGYAKAGLGVVENATRTPKCSPTHWCSLTEVGKIITN